MHNDKKVSLKLDDRVTSICGSITFKDYNRNDIPVLEERFYNLINDYHKIKEYYFIFHDETDMLHMHYMFFLTGQQYVSAILNKICDQMIVEPVAVNYERLISRNAFLRYIIHVDKESIKLGKKQYDYLYIRSNVHSGLIKCLIDSKDEKTGLDFHMLECICVSCTGSEIRIAEFLDQLYLKHYRQIQLILNNYDYVANHIDESELPF